MSPFTCPYLIPLDIDFLHFFSVLLFVSLNATLPVKIVSWASSWQKAVSLVLQRYLTKNNFKATFYSPICDCTVSSCDNCWLELSVAAEIRAELFNYILALITTKCLTVLFVSRLKWNLTFSGLWFFFPPFCMWTEMWCKFWLWTVFFSSLFSRLFLVSQTTRWSDKTTEPGDVCNQTSAIGLRPRRWRERRKLLGRREHTAHPRHLWWQVIIECRVMSVNKLHQP